VFCHPHEHDWAQFLNEWKGGALLSRKLVMVLHLNEKPILRIVEVKNEQIGVSSAFPLTFRPVSAAVEVGEHRRAKNRLHAAVSGITGSAFSRICEDDEAFLVRKPRL
jgi:hypothetical protein